MKTKTSYEGLQLLCVISILFLVGWNNLNRRKINSNKNISADPLPSWSDGDVKNSIIDFVTKVTKAGSADFIPAKDRIATFDNDGTLWAERPYVQELFAFYQVKKMVEKTPALKTQQPFKVVIENDKVYFKNGDEKALLQLVAATHTGMTEDDTS
jgi:hypothetical protein